MGKAELRLSLSASYLIRLEYARLYVVGRLVRRDLACYWWLRHTSPKDVRITYGSSTGPSDYQDAGAPKGIILQWSFPPEGLLADADEC